MGIGNPTRLVATTRFRILTPKPLRPVLTAVWDRGSPRTEGRWRLCFHLPPLPPRRLAVCAARPSWRPDSVSRQRIPSSPKCLWQCRSTKPKSRSILTSSSSAESANSSNVTRWNGDIWGNHYARSPQSRCAGLRDAGRRLSRNDVRVIVMAQLLRLLSVSHTIEAALQSLDASNAEIEARIDQLYMAGDSGCSNPKAQE